jgi:hypothetical protein
MRPVLVKSAAGVALASIALAGVAAGVALGNRSGKPTLVIRPAIHGVNAKGRTLTAIRGRWLGATSYVYEWEISTGRGWELVKRGPVATKLAVSPRIARARVLLRVTARNATGSTVATSRELRPSGTSTSPAITTAVTDPATTTMPTISTGPATTTTSPVTTSSTTTAPTTTTSPTTTAPTTTTLQSAHLTASADPADFGSVRVGQSSSPVTVTFTNTGGHDTGTLSVSIITGDLYSFVLVSTDCSLISVPPGGSCSATVRFTPQSTGTKSQDLYVSDGYPPTAGIALLIGIGTT